MAEAPNAQNPALLCVIHSGGSSLKQEASPQRQGAGEGEEQRRVWNVGGEQGRRTLLHLPVSGTLL